MLRVKPQERPSTSHRRSSRGTRESAWSDEMFTIAPPRPLLEHRDHGLRAAPVVAVDVEAEEPCDELDVGTMQVVLRDDRRVVDPSPEWRHRSRPPRVPPSSAPRSAASPSMTTPLRPSAALHLARRGRPARRDLESSDRPAVARKALEDRPTDAGPAAGDDDAPRRACVPARPSAYVPSEERPSGSSTRMRVTPSGAAADRRP